MPGKSGARAADKKMMSKPTRGNQNRSIEPLVSEFASDRDMADLVEFFISELQDRVGAMRDACQSGDNHRLRGLAHQLKGAAGGYGFPSITQSAAELESTLIEATEAECSAISEKTEALIALCKRAAAGSGS